MLTAARGSPTLTRDARLGRICEADRGAREAYLAMDYLRGNPLVVVAAACCVLAVAAMFATSLLSFRFLQRLRAEAGPFWATHFGTASVGLLRLVRMTPARVAAMSAEGKVLRVCDAYAGPFRLWRILSFVMIGVTVVALVAAGLMGG